MKYKDFGYVIVTDKHNRPMSYVKSEHQLCYCDDENWIDEIFPIKIVSKRVGQNQIKTTIQNRKKWGFEVSHIEYKLMPVQLGR